MTSKPQVGPEGALIDEADIAAALDKPPAEPSIGNLVGLAIDQGKTLVSTQIELVKVKAIRAGKKFGAGAALAAVAGILLFYLLFWLLRTVELAFALIVPAWAAALITAGILLLLIVILVLVGVLLINKGSKDVPDVSGEFEADVTAVKEGLGK